MTDNVGVVVFSVDRAIIGGDSALESLWTCRDSARTYWLKGMKAGETVDFFQSSQRRGTQPGD